MFLTVNRRTIKRGFYVMSCFCVFAILLSSCVSSYNRNQYSEMHLFAWLTASAFFSLYHRMAEQMNITTLNVLDVGSYDVNGNMKTALQHSPLGALEVYYLGIDAEAGPNVDMVVKVSEPWPLEENAFNAIITSSMFEHDPMFWNTFLKMCRVLAPGGLIYVSVPSTGIVHRYPADYWRFYPDAGQAFASWAQENNQDVHMVFGGIIDSELNRDYEDNVMIFRKSIVEEDEVMRDHNLNVLRNIFQEVATSTLRDKDTLLQAMNSVEETNSLCLYEGGKTQCHTVSNYGKQHEVVEE